MVSRRERPALSPAARDKRQLFQQSFLSRACCPSISWAIMHVKIFCFGETESDAIGESKLFGLERQTRVKKGSRYLRSSSSRLLRRRHFGWGEIRIQIPWADVDKDRPLARLTRIMCCRWHLRSLGRAPDDERADDLAGQQFEPEFHLSVSAPMRPVVAQAHARDRYEVDRQRDVAVVQLYRGKPRQACPLYEQHTDSAAVLQCHV